MPARSRMLKRCWSGGILTARGGAPGRNRTCDTRFRKPLLYPLSYEGASAQLTCQRIPTGDRACHGVPTSLTWGGTDRASTHRAHRAPVDRRRASECQPVPTRPDQCQRLTEQPPSTHQDRLIATGARPDSDRADSPPTVRSASVAVHPDPASRPPPPNGHGHTAPRRRRARAGSCAGRVSDARVSKIGFH